MEHITDGAALSLTLQQLHCQDLLHALQCGHVLHEMCLTSYCNAAGTTIVGMRCPVCRFVSGGLDPDVLLNPEAVWSSIVTQDVSPNLRCSSGTAVECGACGCLLNTETGCVAAIQPKHVT